VINIIGRVLTASVSLVITAVLVRYLGQTDYGIVMLALAVMGNTTVLEAAFGMGITRYVAYY